MRLVHRVALAYPYQVLLKNIKEEEIVIGVGKTKREAWENAADSLADKLYVMRDTLSNLLHEQ